MSFSRAPKEQGLYLPGFEHDACGIGFVANIKAKKSHDIIEQGLGVLENLEHRGAQGSEANTGDGAGILIQLPHRLFLEEAERLGFVLPGPGLYGVGVMFLPMDEKARLAFERRIEAVVIEEGQTVLGWRDVPSNHDGLGRVALLSEPYVRQVFVGRSEEIVDDDAFERRLYVIRRRIEHDLRQHPLAGDHSAYCASFSSRTLVYKGMFTSYQVRSYFPDLEDPHTESAFAVVHSRFSTNTFPSWDRAHPYRYVIHNGEINTLRGNVNWMRAREAQLKSDLFGDDLSQLLPIIDEDGSDTAMFDNALEFLVLAGRPLAHAAMMMIPEPWSNHESMSPEKRAFYEYHSCLMEPWDGPAAMVMTDGKQIVAALDRNGLRPARYYVTKGDLIVLASEVGVLDIPPEEVVAKGRLQPGRMLVVDLKAQRIVSDEEVKAEFASQHPYGAWLDEHLVRLEELPEPPYVPEPDHETVLRRQMAFGYTHEELDKVIQPMALTAQERVGSMGIDTPLAVLSERPQLLYRYFKQLFAQVTNPPIDAIREEIVTAVATTLGSEGNLLTTEAEACRQIELPTPILTNPEFYKLVHVARAGFSARTLPILYEVAEGAKGMEHGLQQLFDAADQAIAEGVNILVLSDRGHNAVDAPLPALLAVSALHHHLIDQGTRTQAGLVIESGEPREVHHFAMLIGYGASAINPYLAFESIEVQIAQGLWSNISVDEAIHNYVKACTKGVVKVLSKMGISTIQSYHGAQVFEAIGLNQAFLERYFTGTSSKLQGMGLEEVAEEVRRRHHRAYAQRNGSTRLALESGGHIQWRVEGEEHLYDAKTVYLLQQACRTNDAGLFEQFKERVLEFSRVRFNLRSLLEFQFAKAPIPLDEVEPAESIVRRFKTGAMSFGSISQEAHEALAIAMNRIGGKSNTGEGGEHPSRFVADDNGDLRRSAIKQVASGRFGVTSHYLVNADEIQIKIAQGAKPGEGGQLPGKKVYPWIAEVRHSTPGVGLISPPPHHDIYSIEDLAQLIYDLKNANPRARITVKLVSAVGVGTIAAGVAKGKADLVLISGYDGGTGASPETSIQHAGMPWELGLAETHQTLLLNGLRDRIRVETDGKLLTGRDVAIAALLGADEFGFATGPLVSLGCVMMRVCHLDTCPTGIATQNPELRRNFNGDPQFVVNFMMLVANDLRQYMAKLGIRTVREMVGRSDLLTPVSLPNHWKAKGLDLTPIVNQAVDLDRSREQQDHRLDETLDATDLIRRAAPALERQERVSASLAIRNVHRAVGTRLGSQITRRFGSQGLPEDTIEFRFRGSAGQSFGAFIPRGLSLWLEGDANDYVGKGLSGGKIIVYPDARSTFISHENSIIGNVALYGATSGQVYIAGMAGERFGVRNSGALAVVEGVGDHGLEYMTGGQVVILGRTGRNFAAGMSGGIAYVLDEKGTFAHRCNLDMVTLEALDDLEEADQVRQMIERHVDYTGSVRGKELLADWTNTKERMVRVVPKDYQRMREAIARAKDAGMDETEAAMAAFEDSQNGLVGVGGK